MLFFGALLVHRILWFHRDPIPFIWTFDVAYLSLLMASYILRRPALAPADGVAERYVPFAVPLLNALLLGQRPWQFSAAPLAVPLMVLGGLLAALGAWSLRRHFSIMVEARGVVQSGMYRYIRHPIYLSNLVTISGAVLLRRSLLNAALYLAIVAGQVYRARLEERKLQAHCPEYASYKARVPMFGLRWRVR